MNKSGHGCHFPDGIDRLRDHAGCSAVCFLKWMSVGYFLAVGAGAVAISYVCIKYMDSDGNCSVWEDHQ